MSRSMPCSASCGLISSRISAWGTGVAPTRRASPADAWPNCSAAASASSNMVFFIVVSLFIVRERGRKAPAPGYTSPSALPVAAFDDDRARVGIVGQILAYVLVVELEQELLLAQLGQFGVDPVAQLAVALLHRGRDGRFVAELVGQHAVTGVLLGPAEQHQVVLGVGVATAVGQGLQGLGVLLELEQLPVGAVLRQPDVGGGAGGDDQGLVGQVVEGLNAAVLTDDGLHGDAQVGVGEVHRLGAFGR